MLCGTGRKCYCLKDRIVLEEPCEDHFDDCAFTTLVDATSIIEHITFLVPDVIEE